MLMVDNQGAPLFVDIAASDMHDSRIFTGFNNANNGCYAAFSSQKLKSLCAKKYTAPLASSAKPLRNRWAAMCLRYSHNSM